MPNPFLVLHRLSFPLRAWLAALLFAAPAAMLVICLPGRARRRRLARASARLLYRLMGVPIAVSGLENLPAGACIVAANHASYLDGPLLTAVLPARFGFVIKREIIRTPLAGRLVARLGSEFVDRFDRHAARGDANRLIQLARNGASLGVFPEGTFKAEPGLRAFHLGAFMAATRAGIPVVPVAIRGTRGILPADTLRPRAGHISVRILPPLSADGARGEHARALRDRTRACVLTACGEGDAARSPRTDTGESESATDLS
ncbi:MAG TPA: lysophospholipid acyltransferase family protein [Gammaproteobacteria bacterium]|nr:lysophospholipid acyltransferase family protein [Gammaproteobacteria bacterium]